MKVFTGKFLLALLRLTIIAGLSLSLGALTQSYSVQSWANDEPAKPDLLAAKTAASPVKKGVLVLFPYQPDLPVSMLAEKAIREEFANVSGLSFDMYYEYLDINRFQGDDYRRQLFDLYAAKYRSRQIDLVMIPSETILDLWLASRDRVLPKVPVVFFDISTLTLAGRRFPADVTGVGGIEDQSPSVQWVLHALPSVREIVVVHGVGKADQEFLGAVDAVKKKIGGQVRFTDLSNLPLSEIKKRVATLTKSSVVLYHLMFEDAAGVRYRPIDVARQLASASSVPVISGYDQFIGTGTIGGYMYSIDEQARQAVHIGLRVLCGEPTSAIPIATNETNRFIFDHIALLRFGIPLSDLPPGSIVRNRQYSPWERYRTSIIAVGAVFAILFVAVIFLMGLTRKLHKARVALSTLNANLETQVEERTADLSQTKSRLEDEIVERERSHIALRESEQKLRLFIEHAPAAIAMFDRTMRYIAISRRWLADYGLADEDIVGRSHYEIFPEIPESWKEIHRRCLAGATEKAEEDPFPRLDGTLDWVSWEVLPWYEHQGDIGGIIILSEVVTARKQAEDALRKAYDGLEVRVQERTVELQRAYEQLKEETAQRERLEVQFRQAQKMEALGTMSGGIAHDFNNILAAIIGFSELLEGHTAKGSRDAHRIERITEAAIRGRELVRQMLTFSRKTEQEKKPLAVSSIVKETVKLIRATSPSTIDIRVNASNEALVLGDPTQIQQVLMNLCTNAIYAMREKGGSLHVDLSDHTVSPSNGDPRGVAPGQYVKLSVRDTGTGMSSDIMDKMFDPFFTTKKVGEGTGLGLSVVHGIVKQHEGSITVESEPGRGSTFTIYFPRITGDLETDAADGGALPTGSERILFVDDEEALVEMGEDILAELGYEVVSRMSSREALALFRLDPSRFDLVITDQTMPGMTGIELAVKVLALRRDMPIIMCTGFSHTANEESAKATGIKAFAMKPLTKGEIARTIRKVLDE